MLNYQPSLLLTCGFCLVLCAPAAAQRAPYDVFPPAEPPYFRVRYEASEEPGGAIFPVNYTIWLPPGVSTLRRGRRAPAWLR